MQVFSKFSARGFFAAAAVAGLLPATAIAQVNNSSLQEFVTEFSADKNVDRLLYTDIDGDGIQEALVILEEEGEGLGHKWHFIHDKAGAPQVVFSWAGHDVNPVLDPTVNKRERKRVIASDGMFFGFGNRDAFVPRNSIESLHGERVGPITQAEIDALKQAGETTYSRNDSQVLRYDFFPDIPGTEKTVIVRHESFRDGDMLLPYYIMDHKNNLIHTGMSLFGPELYTHASGGLSIIDQDLKAYTFTYLPSPGPDQE